MLFDLRDAPVSTLLPTQRNQPPTQDPLARMRFLTHAISQPFLIHDSIRFSVLTRQGVKGIIVSRTRSAPRVMDCVDLLSHPNVINFGHLGYDRAVLCSFPELTMLYAWPGEHLSSVISHESTIQMPHCSKLLFDDYCSRLVTIQPGSTIESILDLAAI